MIFWKLSNTQGWGQGFEVTLDTVSQAEYPVTWKTEWWPDLGIINQNLWH